MNITKHFRSGQSFVELMIAIAIGAIFMGGMAVIIAPSLLESGQAGKIQVAATNAQSLLNNVRVWSEGSWNNILSLATGSSYQYYLITSSSPYTATSGIQSVVIATTTYTDYFYVADVYRSAGVIAATSTGNTYDPSTKQVFAVYNWSPHGVTGTISTYITRNDDQVFYQDDWSGGPSSTAVTTSTNSQFASSSDIDYASTTGEIYVAGTSGGGGGGVISLVQATSTVVATGTCVLHLSPTAAGDLLYAQIFNFNTNSFTITDSASDVFTTLVNSICNPYNDGCGAYYLANVPAGVTSITITDPGQSSVCSAAEYSGIATSNPLDVATGQDVTTSSPWTSPATTTTNANDLLLGFTAGEETTIAPSGAWTSVVFNSTSTGPTGALLSEQIVSTIQTNVSSTGTFNSSTFPGVGSWLFAFKAAP
jgi:hypothetical protein